MEKVSRVIERITYHSDESGYGVIKVRVKGFSELLTLTGKFIKVNVGAIIKAKGNFVINKKFGKQFNVKEYKESLPASIYGIEKYLGSGLIEGIGPKFSKYPPNLIDGYLSCCLCEICSIKLFIYNLHYPHTITESTFIKMSLFHSRKFHYTIAKVCY